LLAVLVFELQVFGPAFKEINEGAC
jgi:hypothetical protein